MASKKYKFLFGLLCLISSATFAQVQTGGGYDVLDSSVIPAKRLPQHNEFVNNAYSFPAKPRNQWEIGLKGGLFNVIGDVPSELGTFGFGGHIRKSLGYVFSLRGEYTYGTAKGINWKPRTAGFATHAAGFSAANPFYDNYKTTVHHATLQGVVTFNNIRFHKNKSNFLAYGIFGFGGMIYETETRVPTVGALNGINATAKYEDRKDVKKDIKNVLDNVAYTAAENHGDGAAQLFDQTFRPTATFGAGVAFRLSKRINLALENRITVVKDDLLDGVRYQNRNNSPLTGDFDMFNFGSIGLNFNIGGKSVEPLWWMNPLDYAYNEINEPRHMKLPKPILDDSDGDGVPDQFDKEPNTPAGAPVDSHGVALDTDGDGVPDYRDKELITPTQCQPVDADGVGKCPEPACCDELRKMIAQGVNVGCGIGDLPSVAFTSKSVSLNNDAKALLASVAAKIRNNPNCKIAVVGYGDSNKSAQQLSWDRVNAVINYLVEKEGISNDRFIFKYGEVGGDVNTVDLRDGTNDAGPNTVPAPHPNLRKR